MYRKSYVMPATRANKISKLSVDSDSDSDSDQSCVSSASSASASASASSLASVEEKVSSHAAFASQETSPPFRVWKADEGESRFTTEKNNIFSSPFSRKKVAWSRPRFRSEDSTSAPSSLAASASASASASAEGWVSIEKGIRSTDDDLPDYAPPTPKTEDGENLPISAKPPQEFPSLLKRGSGSVEDQQNALAWAEKIKKNLDNAEKMRVVNKKQKEGGLSFFKRGVSGLQ